MNKSDKTLGYMLFILGVSLLGIGIVLATYSTVVFVNTTVNYGYGNIIVPLATKVQPYQLIGIIIILSGVAFSGIGMYDAEKKHAAVQVQ